jgi:eukaryotic-like serine/threonine-protein kinase
MTSSFTAGSLALAMGRFRVIEELGTGAVGVVHRVHDQELGGDLALKTLLHVSPDDVYQLKQEFRAVSGIVHPNLIRLHELFVEGTSCFFTMELIEGLHLDEYVRGTAARPRSSGVRASSQAQRSSESLPATFRHDRFVDALRQVVSGVAELHAAGRVHRDLKPSNVLVTAEGRAVVLDFGFAVPWRPEDHLTGQEDDVAGTLPYMAPEQLFSGRVGPASDLYSIGVMMFELLTGAHPFAGSAEEVFRAKTRPLGADTLAPLGTSYGPLVAALLDPAPERRPDIQPLLAQLGSSSEPTQRAHGSQMPFVGRRVEIEQLQAAFEDVVASRKAGVVRVEGVSGIGKSELLRRFLAAQSTAARAATGRSRPQESVPYKVFDGAMDELSQELVRLPAKRLRALWPEHTGPLLRLFPVLRRARGDEKEAEAELNADPREERRFAFVALRTLLERIAADMPLILCFDDVQWGDLDSAALLGSLLNPALEAPVLVVLAYRTEELQTSPFLRALDEPGHARSGRTIRLEALSEADTVALGEELLRGYGQSASVDAAAFVRESAGSPFFIGELARNVAEAGAPRTPAALDVVGARLERLSETEQALLETVAVAGRAISLRNAIEASAHPGASRLDLLRLSDLRWLRQTDVELSPAVETYHDRLRERVLQRLAATPERLRDTHRRIASTLDKPGTDAEVLLYHYGAAGNTKAAGRAAVAAAERANGALAFERAAELFLRAAELGAEAHPASTLHELRAEALTNAGRALDAARAFERAAAVLAEPGSETQRLELKRRAGEHYLRTAHYDEGLAIMDEVLRSVGAELPRSQRRALLPSAVRRVRFLWRGIEFTSREPHEIPAATRRRLEALWSAAISLALLDHRRADPIALTHLLEALEHGDCAQALRALAYEAGVQAGIGGNFMRSRSVKIQMLVHTMAEKRGIPYERAWARLAIGSSAWFSGLWTKCVDYCDQGAAIFREQCRGVPWEIATMEMFGMSALGIMGDVEELGRRLPHALQAAEARGDLFGLNNCRLGQPSILWLARGRVAELRDLAAKADRSTWKGGYHTHRYHYAFAVGQADLYDGDPWSCLARLEEHWPGLKEATILYLEWPHVEMRHLRARASLLAARLIRDGAPVPRAHRRLRYDGLVRFVDAEAKAIATHQIPPAAALAATLRLSLASVEGKAGRAALRQVALSACRAADMRLLADLLASPEAGTPELRRALGVDG